MKKQQLAAILLTTCTSACPLASSGDGLPPGVERTVRPLLPGAEWVETAPGKIPLLTLDEIRELESKLPAIGDTLFELADKLSRHKRFECLKVFGRDQFCSCLASKTHLLMSMDQYVIIVTKTKEELRYSDLSPEDQMTIDTTLKARDECVLEMTHD